jgi:signal transduction histidine kinase
MKPITTPIRVLLIDDDLADRQLARLALDKADTGVFKIEFATCLTDAESQLRSDEYDVLLLDLGLPESCGMETLVKVRAINTSIPIVVVTDLSDEQTALDCLHHGAQDYLLKSHLALETLSRSVRYAIQRQQSHEQLSSANALLEQRNTELARLCETAQRFVDNVSHEFRTPLTVITEYVSLLQDGIVGEVELDSEQKCFLGILADRADDLNTMVDDMLDVSKLQAGLLSTWRRNCRLADILRHLRPALESKAAIKDVQLEFRIDADLPVIYCDGEKLGRVLINLVVNAIKFCGDPGCVRVSATEIPASGEVVIAVSDNGPGISQENQKTIFGRFRQLETPVHNAQKGFGLGLSIAKELVDLNLGQMLLDSEMGQGSTFSFTVPVADPVEVARRYLRRLEAAEVAESQLAILEVTIPTELSAAAAEEADAFLNYALRPEDVLFRCDTHRWLFLVPLAGSEVCQYISRVNKLLTDSNRNRPGHPLPEVTTHAVGEWWLTDQLSLLNCLEHLLSERGVVYA